MAKIRNLNAPAADPFGHTWDTPDDVVDVPDHQAVDLLALPHGGWREVLPEAELEADPDDDDPDADPDDPDGNGDDADEAELEQGDEPYDPADHTGPEVLDHLRSAEVDEAEAARILDAETKGRARKGIADHREAILAAKRDRTEPVAE